MPPRKCDQEATAQPTLLEPVVTVAPSVVAQEDCISQESQPTDSLAPLPELSSGLDDALPDTLEANPESCSEAVSDETADGAVDEAADSDSDTISDSDPSSVLEALGTSPANIMVMAEPTSPALRMDGSSPHPPQVTETSIEKSVVRVVETVVETQTEFETYRIKVTATATATETVVVTETQPAETESADPRGIAELFRSMWSVKRPEADPVVLDYDEV